MIEAEATKAALVEVGGIAAFISAAQRRVR